jgi:hypothetical protein
MTESVNGNGTEPAYAEAVRNGRDVLDAGVATIKQQLERMRTAQAVQSQFALERIRLTMEQQMARASLEASKAALTESLRANDYAGVADSICALVEATGRWFRAGGR